LLIVGMAFTPDMKKAAGNVRGGLVVDRCG
jgi:hypothetical protein